MTAQQLKNSILQLAVQGKLVPQDSNDEPASVLLERIHKEKAQLVKAGKIKKSKPLAPITDNEIPFDIPDSWQWCRFGDIIDVSSGKSLTAAQMNKTGKNPVYGGNGITGYHNESNSVENTLVIGRVGFYCGATHITSESAWVTDNALIVSFPQDSVCIHWLRLLIDCANLRKLSSSTAQPLVSGKLIYPLPVPLPPLAEQHRIVAKIEELLPLVEEYGEKHEALEALNKAFPIDLKKSILQSAVQGKLVEQDSGDEPASVLLERIRAEKERLVKEGKVKKSKPLPPIKEDEVPFDLPCGWVWCRLGEVLLKLTDGAHHTPQYTISGIPFLSVKDMSNGEISFDNTRYISKEAHDDLYKRCNPERGDILLTKVGTTGVPVLVEVDREFSLFVSVALLKFNRDFICDKFLVNLLKSPLVQEQCNENTRGVGNKNWVMRDIANTIITLPPLREQERIVARVEELLGVIERM